MAETKTVSKETGVVESAKTDSVKDAKKADAKDVKTEFKKLVETPVKGTAEKVGVKDVKKADAGKNKADKKETKIKADKIYTIPLRKAFRKPRTKRAKYSISIIRNYILTHTKVETVRLGQKLNETIWERGLKNAPRKIRVGVVLDDKEAKVELMGYEFKEFKAQKAKVREGMKEKLMARMSPKALQKQAEDDLIEGRSEETSKEAESETKTAETKTGEKK